MQKYYQICFCAAVTALSLLFNLTMTAQSLGTAPLRQCWELNVEGIGKNLIASDNIGQIYLSYADGVIAAVNIKDGKQFWKTELGGQIEEIIYDDKNLYVISANNSSQDKPETQTEKTEKTVQNSIRALSAETGVVKWQKVLEANQNSSWAKISIIPNGNYVYFVTSGGQLYKLAKETGAEVEKISLGADVTAEADFFQNSIYIGTNQKSLDIYSTKESTIKKVALNEIPTVVFAGKEIIVVGDRLGRLTGFNADKGNKEWQTRTGAEIANITQTNNGMAVSSNDNFIYLISEENGEKVWKKRLAGRTTTVSSRASDVLLVVNLNGELSTLLETENGKTINQVAVQTPKFFVNKPLLINNMIVFHTNTGLVAYSSAAENCLQEEKTADK